MCKWVGGANLSWVGWHPAPETNWNGSFGGVGNACDTRARRSAAANSNVGCSEFAGHVPSVTAVTPAAYSQLRTYQVLQSRASRDSFYPRVNQGGWTTDKAAKSPFSRNKNMDRLCFGAIFTKKPLLQQLRDNPTTFTFQISDLL